jgi:cytochrome b6-f complex iron-sulfur subunit
VEKNLERRRFLGILLTALGSTAIASFAYPLLRFVAPPLAKSSIQKLTIRKDDISAGEAKEIVLGNTPAIIINVTGKGYIVLSRICTHLGCLVQYDKGEQKLVCPCHAGFFDLEGHVISGPPPKPLQTIPLSVEGGNIIIG